MTASTSPRPRVLLVSWLFPPHNSIGAKRAFRFARHLPASGWDVTVLCGREPPRRFVDPTSWHLPNGVRVERDYDAAWLTQLANRADARAHSARSNKRDVLPRANVKSEPSHTKRFEFPHDILPTETIAVHLPHAIHAARRLVETQTIRAVWTTSYPYSAHFIGLALKRQFGIPFIADLRDPWTLNFVHDQKIAAVRWLERRMEHRIFDAADRIVVTTEALADAYRKLYPAWRDRFVTIRNGFDDVSVPPRSLTPEIIRLVHFGHVYGERSLEPILRAVAVLRASRWKAIPIRLENYGRISDHDRAVARALRLDDALLSFDPLPYNQGLASLRAAHALLLPAWGTNRGSLFLPGKLYDYLVADAPIVAVGENPELADILKRTGAGVLCPSDSVQTIVDALTDAVATSASHRANPAVVAEFSAQHASARLATVLNELTGTPHQGLH